MANETDQHHPGLSDLLRYPLVDSILNRRTRRVSRGTSLAAGELSHSSANQPCPLNPLEEAVLIVTTGLTGITVHDAPFKKPDGTPEDLGSPFTNAIGRSASSADNSQATSFFMINDDGVFLIKNPRGRRALEVMRELPPRWDDWRESDWLAAANVLKQRLYTDRLEFPREFPFYIGWNKQISNRPGTTIFFPVVDCTRQYINILLILLSEPAGQRPLIIDDWQKFRPKDLADWMGWVAMHLGWGPKIPYQPIGGVKRARGGFVNPDVIVPLGAGHTLRTDYELFFLLQNLMLLGQAMGLGGWVHGSIWPLHILRREPSKGWLGLGFRFEPAKTHTFRRAPPLPADQPNPVGIDGVLEGLCPPYVASMDEAADRVVDEKYGSQGVYTDADIFSRSYRKRRGAEEYLRHQNRHPPEAIQYAKDICNYIYDTYGRFPAHIDAFYTPGMWLQFSHLELEYYEKFYDPALFAKQAEHDSIWHAKQTKVIDLRRGRTWPGTLSSLAAGSAAR